MMRRYKTHALQGAYILDDRYGDKVLLHGNYANLLYVKHRIINALLKVYDRVEVNIVSDFYRFGPYDIWAEVHMFNRGKEVVCVNEPLSIELLESETHHADYLRHKITDIARRAAAYQVQDKWAKED